MVQGKAESSGGSAVPERQSQRCALSPFICLLLCEPPQMRKVQGMIQLQLFEVGFHSFTIMVSHRGLG